MPDLQGMGESPAADKMDAAVPECYSAGEKAESGWKSGFFRGKAIRWLGGVVERLFLP
jgi:hypothetical protein